MTKKIAELTGSLSSVTVGLLLIFVILISPHNLSFPSLEYHKAPESAEDSAASVAQITKIEEEKTIEVSPAHISGLNEASLTATLFGKGAREVEGQDSTVTSLVLSSHLSPADLGCFPITYRLTDEEYNMLLYCVDMEARSGSLEHKILIAQVIMNRVQGIKFPTTVAEVVNAPAQFDVMPRYASRGEWEPVDNSREAVDLVLSGTSPDYAQGALYFYNPQVVGQNRWFDNNLEFICEIEGHRFYK